MVELEQLNIHSSRDIIARHGLTLPELFELSLEFYKEEKHQFNLSYDQKNQLAAYWRQSALGPYHPDKLNPGYFDFVGNDRKKAWEALGEISANGAMAGFCNLLETVCPDLVPWIRHKKRERENKIKDERLKEEARRKKEAVEDMEASRLINIVKKADQLKKKADQLKKQSVDDASSEDEEMPTLEKNERRIIYAVTTETSEVEQPLQNGVNHDSHSEPINCPTLLLPEESNGNAEDVISNGKTDSVEPSSDKAAEEPAPQAVDLTKKDQSTANESINDSQVTAEASVANDTAASEATSNAAASADSLNTVLTQHFACILYLTQMRDSGHTLSAEQENYLSQMSAYEDQLKLLKTNIVQAKGTQEITSVQESGRAQQSDTQNEGLPAEGNPAPLESVPTSQESFSVLNSEESLQIIHSADVVTDTERVSTGEVTTTSQVTTNPEVGKPEKEEVPTVGAPEVPQEALVSPEQPPEPAGILNDLQSQQPGVDNIEKEIADIPESPDLGAPANATELSALAETLQKQLPDTPTENHLAPGDQDGEGSECESESDVKMWSKSGVDLFIAEVSQDADSVLHVGRGETVTVRIPTYESGTALYWEFATQNYDIGFGASFEWEEEVPAAENPLSVTSSSGGPRDVTVRVRREPILPILRRSSHEKVITGSHAFPRGGTYLLMFDNSYSLLRSKTVYYRVFYTR